MQIVAALAEGQTVRAVARRFDVSVASVVRIGQRQKAGLGQAPLPMGGPRRMAIDKEAGEWLMARLYEKPDLSVRAVTAELAARGTKVAPDTVWRYVRRVTADETDLEDPEADWSTDD